MAKVFVDADYLNDGLELISDTIRERGEITGLLSFPEGIANAIPTKGGGGIPIPSPIVSGNTPVYQETSFPRLGNSGSTYNRFGGSDLTIAHFVCKRAGTYYLYASVGMYSTSRFGLRFYKNGAAITTTQLHSASSSYLRDYGNTVELNIGDTIDVYSSGGGDRWLTGFTVSIDWDNTFY